MFPWHNAPEVGSSVRSEIFVANQPKKHLKLRQERNMALLTELEFRPSSHYRNVAPAGAFHERQGIGGVPWHHEPPPVVGVSCRAADVVTDEKWDAHLAMGAFHILGLSFLILIIILLLIWTLEGNESWIKIKIRIKRGTQECGVHPLAMGRPFQACFPRRGGGCFLERGCSHVGLCL